MQKVWVFIVLFAGMNIVAWDWVKSENRRGIGLVLFQSEEYVGSGYYRSRETVYSGINPGIIIHSETTSYVLSLLVGGVLPFFIAGALSRRQRPLEAIPRAVAGAPR